ncbi:hypothetical protein K9F62_11150 [Desulfovibrio sp. JY]|nr:hypothetical protein K9F62_11150 [Desulfovibrio sp. JY]
MSTTLLPLEQYLQADSKGILFPDRTINYFDRYIGIKTWLEASIFSKIEKINAALDSGYYTDHGMTHVNDLIKYAGDLLGASIVQNENTQKIILNPYEIFLLLLSALLHDSGMYYGRKDHENSVAAIITKMGPIFQGDSFEKSIVSSISGAHSGKKDGTPFDTIAKLDKLSGDYLSIKFRPKLISGLIRFSDEISETKLRADESVLADGLIKTFTSIVCHKYASYIINSIVDREAKTVKIDYWIPFEDVKKKITVGENSTYMIDEICKRLDKMNQERIYCCRYISEAIYISKINFTISVNKLNEDGEIQELLYENKFIVGDNGYPTSGDIVSRANPELVGTKFKKLITKRI